MTRTYPPDDKLAEALSKAAGDYKRLQDQVAASLKQMAALSADNPIARELLEQAKPEIEAGHFKRAHELLRHATQAQIAAAQEAYKLQEQAHAAAEAQMKGAASSTAAEGDVALTRSNQGEIALPIRDLSSPRAARHLLPTAAGEPLRFLARRMSGNTPRN
jgi:hypothetical protein